MKRSCGSAGYFFDKVRKLNTLILKGKKIDEASKKNILKMREIWRLRTERLEKRGNGKGVKRWTGIDTHMGQNYCERKNEKKKNLSLKKDETRKIEGRWENWVQKRRSWDLSIYLSIYLSVFLSVCPSVCRVAAGRRHSPAYASFVAARSSVRKECRHFLLSQNGRPCAKIEVAV